MKNKFTWILSLLLVVVFVITACNAKSETPATGTVITATATSSGGGTTTVVTTGATTSATTTSTTTGADYNTPQYGGWWTFGSGAKPGEWDPAAPISGRSWMLTTQGLIFADLTKGPQGTGEYPYNSQDVPYQFFTGGLAQSFEQPDLTHVIYTIRQGVKYMPKPGVTQRTVTTADVIFCMMRAQNHPRSFYYRGANAAPEKYWQPKVDTNNPWKIIVTLPAPNVFWAETSIGIYPPETVRYADANDKIGSLSDWRDANGTGPMICTDFVLDSSITYVKNPDYWEPYPLNPKYKLPFVDGDTVLIIPDLTTLQSAMRAHKIASITLSIDDAKAMKKSNPELQTFTQPSNYNQVIFFRTDIAPFSDINFRKALTIAIDRQSILKDYRSGEGILLSWPFWPSAGNDIYTPLDQLPADVQELFKYDPVKAKEYLTKAGFPNGTKITFSIAATPPQMGEIASIVSNYWNAVGIQTTIDAQEAGLFYNKLYAVGYDQVTLAYWSNASPNSVFAAAWYTNPGTGKPQLYNYSAVKSSRIDDDWAKIKSTLDPKERAKIYKEEGIWGMQQVWEICLPMPYDYTFVQPWIKGYKGEYASFAAWGWIDRNLEKKWTGKNS